MKKHPFFGALKAPGASPLLEDSRGKLRWCPGRNCSAAAGEPLGGLQEADRDRGQDGARHVWGTRHKMMSFLWIWCGFSMEFPWDLNGISEFSVDLIWIKWIFHGISSGIFMDLHGISMGFWRTFNGIFMGFGMNMSGIPMGGCWRYFFAATGWWFGDVTFCFPNINIKLYHNDKKMKLDKL